MLFVLCPVVSINYDHISGDDEKTITKKYCKNDAEFNLRCGEGVFLYDYIDNWAKLDEEQLPPWNKHFFQY